MLVTFEGIDCSGKSTCLQEVKTLLESKLINYITTREPGGPRTAEEIRKTLLESFEPMTAEAEILLFYAARMENMKHIIKPNANNLVLCDRFYDSTFAYQLANDPSLEDFLTQIHQTCLNGYKPDLTIFLDISLDTYMERSAIRNEELDAMERKGLEYLKAVTENYRKLFRNQDRNVAVVDANRPLNEVVDDVKNIISRNISSWQKADLL